MANWATKWWKKDKKEDKKKASSYWYDDYSSDFDYAGFYSDFSDGKDYTAAKDMQKSLDLYKLSATRRAISNFVNIVTGRNIPVAFAGKNSYTNGTTVNISADIDDKFDVGVGLALHEGSHIVLSDFKLLAAVADFTKTVRTVMGTLTSDSIDEYLRTTSGAYIGTLDRIYSPKRGLLRHSMRDASNIENDLAVITDTVIALNNWIEDRRIDQYIYKNSPGYRQYYLTMYDNYFNDKSITKGIESDEYTDEKMDSYIFRIINLTNEKTNLNKLKGLRAINKILDLNNISRLKTTTDSINLAVDVIEEIYKHINAELFNRPASSNPSMGNGDMHIEDITEGESSETGGSSGQIGDSMVGQASTESSKAGSDASSADGGKKATLSAAAAEKLAKMFTKQKDFLKNGVKQKKLSATDQKRLTSIDESGGELQRVGADSVYGPGSNQSKGVDCVIIKRVTKSILDSDEFPFGKNDQVHFTDEVAEGLRLGTMLGNKLSIRSESRDTVFNRLNKGKIDQRLISGLGYGSESVFYTKEIDQYKKANLHISLDYSGSMSGNKLAKTVVCATAIVKAASMARNINVQVSIRSTTQRGDKPLIAIIYDSRKDSLNHFRYMMERLHATNTTPEGLTFEAIMKHFVATTKDVDSYFLNFSDGEPAFQINGFNYQGRAAAEHTAKQVRRIKDSGINVLSYFISESSNGMDTRSWELFKQCYGDTAKCINPRNMVEVARSMNEMFLKKNAKTL